MPPTSRRPIHKVLIANRGEIACRIASTCHRLGMRTVAVYSDVDRDAMHVRLTDEAVPLPGNAPSDTYLRGDLLIDAACRTGADAVHPGYGFLAESADFAQAVLDAGLIWVGPPPSAMRAMGDKVEAKRHMRVAGVTVLPDDTVEGTEALDAIGFPLMVKAAAGGGGRGMRLVERADQLDEAMMSARREAEAAFGDGAVFVERYLTGARHVEVQVLADSDGATVSLFERECSVQRRHQKLIEEAPSVAVDEVLRMRMGHAACAAAEAVGYVGAGTVEFLLDDEENFFFLEMNTRLQVEHPVTESITGLDLVELQLLVAEGLPLPSNVLDPTRFGHAVEARVLAEDPANGYQPSLGRFRRFWLWAGGGATRIDEGLADNSDVSPHYDSLLAKVIGRGDTREQAIAELVKALREAVLHGPPTNRDQLIRILTDADFVAGRMHTGFLDTHDTTRPITGDVEVAAIAAAFADRELARRSATVLGWVEPGWRNNRSAPQVRRYRYRDDEYHVGYAGGRSGRVTVNGTAHDVVLANVLLDRDGYHPVEVSLIVDGVRRSYFVGEYGTDRYVDAVDGHVTLRLVDPLGAASGPESAPAGSLVAPMPGNVTKIMVTAGATVEGGQTLVVVEAMKMEHAVRSPSAGIVTDVLVGEDAQVDTGQPLVVLDDGGTG